MYNDTDMFELQPCLLEVETMAGGTSRVLADIRTAQPFVVSKDTKQVRVVMIMRVFGDALMTLREVDTVNVDFKMYMGSLAPYCSMPLLSVQLDGGQNVQFFGGDHGPGGASTSPGSSTTAADRRAMAAQQEQGSKDS